MSERKKLRDVRKGRADKLCQRGPSIQVMLAELTVPVKGEPVTRPTIVWMLMVLQKQAASGRHQAATSLTKFSKVCGQVTARWDAGRE